MIECYFDPAKVGRLPAGATAELIDNFASSLRRTGFAESTTRRHVRTANHVAAWLAKKEVHLKEFNRERLDAFAAHLRTCRCSWRARVGQGPTLAGARRFLDYLVTRGIAHPTGTRAGGVPEIIEAFEQWMARHRGVTTSTLITYRPILVELVVKVGDPKHLSAAALRQFVSERAARHGRCRTQTVVAAVRMMLRYLALQGMVSADLIDAVHSVANWRLSSLPTYLSREDVERVLNAPDPRTATGQRDRAILLLLARLGLRACDVAQLRMADIDWGAGTLLVSGKGRRPCKLPLPQDVGDAILVYVNNARPAMEDEHVFLTTLPPLGHLRSSAVVSAIVCSAANRAGVDLPRVGAHVMRHSLATMLVRDGVQLPAIGALLRHRRAETTTLYAKLDLPALRKIAQPWPLEAPQC